MAIKVGIAGGRGLYNLLGFRSIPDVEVTAMCDINEEFLNRSADAHNIPKRYRVFEDMLESDIDVAVVSTPMQCHTPQAILALEAGKHVFSEVTAAVSMDELWWLIESVEKSGKVYMMAENCNYYKNNKIVETLVKQGRFGDVYYAEGGYLHNAIELTKNADGKPTWRKYWHLGVRGAFYPTHCLGPIMKWFGDDRIVSVMSMGTGWHTHPEFRQEDTSSTLCRTAAGRLINLRIDCISNRPYSLYYNLQGTKGCYESPRAQDQIHRIWLEDAGDDHRDGKWRDLREFRDLLPDYMIRATAEQDEASHEGSDFFIVQDFMKAVRGEQESPVNVYEACEWTAVALLSTLSVENEGKLMTMPNFRKNMPRSEQRIAL